MVDFLHRAVTVDTYTLVVVALLSGWAGVLTLHVLSRTMLALVFVPGFVLGALVTNYAFEVTGFYPTSDRETNVVIACTMGIIIALFALLIVMRFTAVIARLRVEHHRFRHDIKPKPAFAREPRRL
ncbi:conserved membrane protein of unknown function [Hyphomicrobium sp. 1Nfss2.1]|uniref:hypothetical protein n=1 Tax=Hyphomicrobium sp. 1Nfss2.1 TaxID=3413936 RepID=UPI003C79E9A8